MSLFQGSLRPAPTASDEAIERYVTSLLGAPKPDPLFRRRLRSTVVNQYVAGREDRLSHAATRQMGRLGRAVLYASLTLAVSATGVLAASQDSLPGEALYPLKLRIEALRLEVLPDHLHDDLAAYALSERVQELSRLADRGDWTRVGSLTEAIEGEYAELIAGGADGGDAAARHLLVLENLVERLPDPAREAVEAAIEHGSGGGPQAPAHEPPAWGITDHPGRGDGPDGAGPHGATNGGEDRAATPSPSEAPLRPSRTPPPQKSREPESTSEPTPTPPGSPAGEPARSPSAP